MDKDALVGLMTGLLQNALTEQNGDARVAATAALPLVGENAALTSLRLVTLIADIESALADTYDADLTLVSEKALSRERSPFRTLDALSDYVLELLQPSPAVVLS